MLNEYLTAEDRPATFSADYERDFKQYELLPQPKITAVDAAINIYPDRRSFDGTGRFTLQNKTDVPIAQMHLTDAQQTVSNVTFDRPFHLVSRAPRDLYSIYALDQPLAPGDVVTMTFRVSWTTHGFRDGNELAQYSPTTARSSTWAFFPTIGYDRNLEIDDPRRRREEHLGPLVELAGAHDPCTRSATCSRPSRTGSRITRW